MSVAKTLIIGLFSLTVLLPAGLSSQAAVPARKLIDVREYTQKYPLSCEAAASSVALQYLGLDIAEDQVLALMPIDKTPKSLDASGNTVWGDPEKGFVGDYNGVYLKTGYGIYAVPLAKSMTGLGVNAQAGSHHTLQQLYQAISDNHPVVVWVPTRFEHVAVKTWKTPSGTMVKWIEHEHAMVFRGYDQEQGLVYLMDVHEGKYQTRTVKEFARAWAYLDNQAIIFSRLAQ